MATQIHLSVDYKPTLQLYITHHLYVKKPSKVGLLQQKDLGEFTLALVIQTLLLPQREELYITPALYILNPDYAIAATFRSGKEMNIQLALAKIILGESPCNLF